MQCQPVVDKQGLNEHSGAPKDFEKGRAVTMRKGFMEKINKAGRKNVRPCVMILVLEHECWTWLWSWSNSTPIQVGRDYPNLTLRYHSSWLIINQVVNVFATRPEVNWIQQLRLVARLQRIFSYPTPWQLVGKCENGNRCLSIPLKLTPLYQVDLQTGSSILGLCLQVNNDNDWIRWDWYPCFHSGHSSNCPSITDDGVLLTL